MKSIKVALIAILAITVAGCSGIRKSYFDPLDEGTSIGSPPGSIFPHAENWGDYNVHGKYVIDNGNVYCQNACHGDNLEGGTARSCRSEGCHVIYTHPPAKEWLGLLGHGKHVRDSDGPEACATKCHGEDYAGGYNPGNNKSCMKCHNSYPPAHLITGWNNKGHGEFLAQSDNQDECTTMCHRSDVPENMKIASCTECHGENFGEHASADWPTKDGHGKYVIDNGVAGCQNACHGIDFEGGTAIGCKSETCHPVYPHTPSMEWVEILGHGRYIITGGNITTCAKNCHGIDYLGGYNPNNNKSCIECHTSYPPAHLLTNWDQKEHKDFLVETKDIKECLTMCHRKDLPAELIIVGCEKCHGDTFTEHASALWPDKDGHGQKGHSSEINACKKCHGESLTGGDVGGSCATESCHKHDAAGEIDKNDCHPCHVAMGQCIVCHSQ